MSERDEDQTIIYSKPVEQTSLRDGDKIQVGDTVLKNIPLFSTMSASA